MVTLGIDGLIAIACKNGLVAYSTVFGPGAKGLTCFVTLVFDDREVAYEVFESDEVGGKSRVWSCFPEKMLCSYAVSQTIRKHFKDAVEAVEKGL